MPDSPDRNPTPGIGPDKLLAIGAYGEMVAAYRYLILAEKAPDPRYREEFAAMADEEQDHKQRLEGLLAELYPKADFILTAADKELVVTGPRLIEVRDEEAFHEAMRMILITERKTAAFYGRHAGQLPQPRLRALFQELAEEGADHFQRLKALARQSGMTREPEEPIE